MSTEESTPTTPPLDPKFAALKEITQEDLETHDEDSENPWLLINGYICDVTEYRFEHPGGEGILSEHAGSDASEAFGNVGHTDFAKKKMENLAVGRLKGYKPKDETEDASSSDSSVLKFVLIPIVLLLVAYFVNQYVKSLGN
uniref:Cytochrome b5 heme-binding domain-containing protein n=1 Tax=Percolomonas cosmopolitus TaxID=63605 RepID=A0A7S1KPD2_9EUKA